MRISDWSSDVCSADLNNFVKTILRAARAGRPLRVVDDQTGSPTYAGDLADAIIRLGKGACIPGGLYHYSGDRALSWYAFERRITKIGRASCRERVCQYG